MTPAPTIKDKVEIETARLEVIVQYLSDKELRRMIRANLRKSNHRDALTRGHARLSVSIATKELGDRRRAC